MVTEMELKRFSALMKGVQYLACWTGMGWIAQLPDHNIQKSHKHFFHQINSVGRTDFQFSAYSNYIFSS